jgi:RNA polymerase sigma-70 factor (ECF subfamily)
MHGLPRIVSEVLVSRVDSDLDREFDDQLAAGATLAFRVAYGVLRRREDAEDVAQEALARAYRRRHTLRDGQRFRGWLVRIAWRLAIDHRRGALRRERREQEASLGLPAASVEEMAAENQARQRLFAALDELPDKLRMALTLFGIEGHGVREVAALLGVPEGTVKSRIHLARRQLLEKLR